MTDFRVIQGCPVNSLIAPYIAIVCNDAKVPVLSIYRGDDARAILHKHGHHSQYELYHATPAQRAAWHILGTPNAPGHSTHELRSDGRAFPHVPDGRPLENWQQGFDVEDGAAADRVIAAGRRYGWVLFRPYVGGAEAHHLCFRQRPKWTPRTLARILRLRATLPRS